MLVRVLTEPTNSLLAQKKLEFAMDGADLSFSTDALDEIAALALERKTGARALRSIVEKVCELLTLQRHSHAYYEVDVKIFSYNDQMRRCYSKRSSWYREVISKAFT